MTDEFYSESASKRQWLAFSLIIGCIICAGLLINDPVTEYKHLQSLTESDSLIMAHFNESNINRQQVRRRQTQVDSVFFRTHYTVELPRGFPRSSFHHKLLKKIQPYGLNTYAFVEFPEQHTTIHILYSGKVIGTVRLIGK